MANNFDQFPIYDPLVKRDAHMSDIWVAAITNFYENLIVYLTQNGIFLPLVTTAQRNAIQSPQNGQMIYNTTTGAPQIFQQGVWKTFTTV